MTRKERREKLIKHLKYNRSIGADYLITDEDADEIIKALDQEPKTGQWIRVIDEIDSLGNKTWHHECSVCGCNNSGWGNLNKFCPNCGSRMSEVSE